MIQDLGWRRFRDYLWNNDCALILGGRGIQLGSSLLISVGLVKKFGLASLGTYTIAGAVAVVFGMVCCMGLNYSLPRESLSDPERNSVAVVWGVLSAALSMVCLYGYSLAMAKTAGEVVEIYLFAASGVIFSLTNVSTTLLVLQRRTRLSLTSSLLGALGVAHGLLWCTTVTQFAWALLAYRTIGSAIPFAFFRYAWVKPHAMLRSGLRGMAFIPADLFAILSEQSMTLILNFFLTREELGIIGLCRQVLTAADTPGWSFMQAKYPELIRQSLGAADRIYRQTMALSVASAVFAAMAAYVLGSYVMHIDKLFPMMLVLCLLLPARYTNDYSHNIIRSQGMVRVSMRLSFLKMIIGAVIFFTICPLLGAWGAIFGLALLSLISAIMSWMPAQMNLSAANRIQG